MAFSSEPSPILCHCVPAPQGHHLTSPEPSTTAPRMPYSITSEGLSPDNAKADLVLTPFRPVSVPRMSFCASGKQAPSCPRQMDPPSSLLPRAGFPLAFPFCIPRSSSPLNEGHPQAQTPFPESNGCTSSLSALGEGIHHCLHGLSLTFQATLVRVLTSTPPIHLSKHLLHPHPTASSRERPAEGPPQPSGSTWDVSSALGPSGAFLKTSPQVSSSGDLS